MTAPRGMMNEFTSDCVRDEPVRVVVVDDVADHRALCRAALADRDGIVVEGEAADGASACELVEQTAPDAIVLDLRMPVLDGFEAIPLLRTLSPTLRIVVWSGTADAADLQRALELGAHAALVKTSTPDELAAAVERTVRGWRERAERSLVRSVRRGALLHAPQELRALRPWQRRRPRGTPAAPVGGPGRPSPQ